MQFSAAALFVKPLCGWWYLKLCAVFCNGAARDTNPLRRQRGCQRFIGDGLPRRFFGDKPLYPLVDGHRGQGAKRSVCGRLRKQTAQRNNFCPEQNIFFLYRPTDCGRVYTKGSRNVLYRHGLQGLSAEKVVLALYDLGQQTGQRSLAVLQAVDQFLRPPKLFF